MLKILIGSVALTLGSFFIFGIGDQYGMPLLRSIGIYGVLTGGGILILFRLLGALKKEEKFQIENRVFGEFDIQGSVIITDDPKFRDRSGFSFPKGPSHLTLKLKVYEKGGIEIESIILNTIRDHAGTRVVKSMGELVVDSGLIFIVDDDALTNTQAKLPIDGLDLLKESPSAKLLMDSNEKAWGVTLLPPWGDGGYPITQISDDNGIWGIECNLMPDED